MPSSWSDLPLDLLISIRNKLQLSQRSDLRSFRSVCSQWYYIVPVPNPCPRYNVEFDTDTNIIHLAMDNNSYSSSDYYIFLPFCSSSPFLYFCSSNGWLVFVTPTNEILHLYDPVSNRKLIFPPLYPNMLRYYKKVKPIARNPLYLDLEKVVVSSSNKKGTAVAGIVKIRNRIDSPETRIIFCRNAYGDCQRWSLLMEGSKDIIDIAAAGDGRFYAIGSAWELYMLDERPPLIILMRIKLWLPKHILAENCLITRHHTIKESGETDLIISGPYFGHNYEINWMSLKINVAKLRVNSNNIKVGCDVRLNFLRGFVDHRKTYFTPSLRNITQS